MLQVKMRRGSTVLPLLLLISIFAALLSPFLWAIGADFVFAILGRPVEGRVVATQYVAALTACSAGRQRHPAYRYFDYRFVDAAGAPQHISERFVDGDSCPSLGDTVQIEYLPAFGDAARRHDHNPGVAITHILVPIAVIPFVLFILIKREEPRPRVFIGLASEDRSS
jgi:hypothetical protein